MFWPCETRTSTCRNFATISSGVYRFFGIAVLLHVQRHSSGRTTFQGEDHIADLRLVATRKAQDHVVHARHLRRLITSLSSSCRRNRLILAATVSEEKSSMSCGR